MVSISVLSPAELEEVMEPAWYPMHWKLLTNGTGIPYCIPLYGSEMDPRSLGPRKRRLVAFRTGIETVQFSGVVGHSSLFWRAPTCHGYPCAVDVDWRTCPRVFDQLGSTFPERGVRREFVPWMKVLMKSQHAHLATCLKSSPIDFNVRVIEQREDAGAGVPWIQGFQGGDWRLCLSRVCLEVACLRSGFSQSFRVQLLDVASGSTASASSTAASPGEFQDFAQFSQVDHVGLYFLLYFCCTLSWLTAGGSATGSFPAVDDWRPFFDKAVCTEVTDFVPPRISFWNKSYRVSTWLPVFARGDPVALVQDEEAANLFSSFWDSVMGCLLLLIAKPVKQKVEGPVAVAAGAVAVAAGAVAVAAGAVAAGAVAGHVGSASASASAAPPRAVVCGPAGSVPVPLCPTW